MKESLKTQKISRLIQKNLSEIFQKDLNDITKPGLVSITLVKTSTDYSISNIYLSILAKDRKIILEKIIENRSLIRKHLGNKIANKIRKIPILKFYIDDSFDNALKISNLLKKWSEVVMHV